VDTTETRRRAGPLTQVLWATGVGLLVVVAAGGLTASYARPEVVVIPELLEALDAVAVSYRAVVTAFALPVLSALVLVALVGLTRRTDPMALLFSLALLGMFTYTAGFPMALRDTFPAASIPALIAEIIALEALAFVIYLFPSGHFVPGWTRFFLFPCAFVVVAHPPLATAVRMVAVQPESVAPYLVVLTNAVTVVLMGGAVVGQIIRYRRHSSQTQRLQMAWVFLGMSLIVVPATVQQLGAALFPGRWVTWTLLMVTLGAPLIPMFAGVAIFRHRLYDLDRVVRRTVVYAVLTASLGAIYTALVVAMSQLTPDGSNLVVAAATLVVAALFTPLRRRLQSFVDRRFNRSKFDPDEVAENLGARLREVVDPAGVVREFTATVSRTIEPASIGFWMADDHRSGVSGRDGGKGSEWNATDAALHSPQDLDLSGGRYRAL
jgi:hypothetical protein